MFFILVSFYLLLDLLNPSNYTISILIGISIISLVIYSFRNVDNDINRIIKYFFYLIIISSIAYLNTPKVKIDYKLINTEKAIFCGKVIEIINENNRNVKLIANGRIDSQNMEPFQSKIYLKYYKPYTNLSSTIDISINDQIYANIELLLPKSNQLFNEFDEALYLKSKGVPLIGKVNNNSLSVTRNGSGFFKFIEKLNQSISKKINNLFSSQTAPIINAMLLGDKTDIDRNARNKFSFTGTAHIIAISGLHIGIIATILFLILTPISNPKIKIIIFSIILISFIILSGLQASAIRAAGMAIFFYYSIITHRKVEPLNLLGIVSLIYFIFSPLIIFSLSFQMSFFAVLGIFLFYSKLYKSILKVIKQKLITASLSISIATSIFLFPIIAFHFNTVAFISFIANLFIVPIASLALIYSILSIGFYYINESIADLFSKTTDALFDIIFYINDVLFLLPHSFYKGEFAFLISIIIVFFIIIILYNSKKQYLFRLLFGVIAFSLIYLTFITNKSIDIYSNNNINSIEIPINDNIVIYYISDRYGGQYPRNYWSLNEKIITDNRDIILCYNGNQGINISDKVKKYRKIRIVEFGINEEATLQTILNLGINIPVSTKLKIKNPSASQIQLLIRFTFSSKVEYSTIRVIYPFAFNGNLFQFERTVYRNIRIYKTIL